MPELPEVELTRKQLQQFATGSIIERIYITEQRIIETPAMQQRLSDILNRQITHCDRRGKLLLIHLDNTDTLAIHRRMAGNLTLLARDAPNEPYICAVFFLRAPNGSEQKLLFTDPRKFGRIGVYHSSELAQKLAKLGPEPLQDDFTDEALKHALSSANRPIKTILLDQSKIAGIGNIYADESLFAAGIHPKRNSHTLTDTEIHTLRLAIVTTLVSALEHAGTTFGRHRDLFGAAGKNVDYLHVYQREGAPCKICGSAIQSIRVAQRGTRFCPTCQK